MQSAVYPVYVVSLHRHRYRDTGDGVLVYSYYGLEDYE